MTTDIRHQSGFGNFFSTEALVGVLPVGQNSPQRVARGLYAEQLSGDAFTALPHENRRSWLYRIMPSVTQGNFAPLDLPAFRSAPDTKSVLLPNQLRWDPLPLTPRRQSFLEGIVTVCVTGSVEGRNGGAVHLYAFDQPMHQSAIYNADGEWMLLPDSGTLIVRTELGVLEVAPGEICVLPRGLKVAVNAKDVKSAARGYICENYGEPFRLPYRGPIGANGLANERDFLYPVAAFEDSTKPHKLTCKFGGKFYSAELPHSPFDVVAWHGNLAPYKYDLSRFNTINTVSFDHPDPSIFTVLTSPSNHPGVANLDFVIFPPRWMVAKDTFRPPYYHRNVMSEYMGLIKGVYDAKPAGGFVPGGGSLHNCMAPHGPERAAFLAASEAELKPHYLADTMAFMVESPTAFATTEWARTGPQLQKDYLACWKDLPRQFK